MRTDVTVKLDAEVVKLAKVVAAYRELSVAEYLSNTLDPIVRQDLETEQTKHARKKPGAPVTRTPSSPDKPSKVH